MGQISFTPIGKPEDTSSPPLSFTPIREPEDTTVNPPGNTSPAPSITQPDASSMLKTGISKTWDFANSSIFGVKEPTPEEIQHEGMSAVVRKGVANLTTPLSLLGEAAGGLGLIKGAKYLRGAGEAAPEIEAIKPPVSSVLENAAQDTNVIKPKLKLSTNADGTFTNKDTGEILGKDLNPLTSRTTPKKIKITFSQTGDLPKAEIPPFTGKVNDTSLPNDLKGAKPKFNIRDKSYTPKFDSDVDKAAFITAQINPSKRDADYLKFVMDNTGLDEQGARDLGKQVKGHVKDTIKNHILNEGQEGDVLVPKFKSDIETIPKTEPININSGTMPNVKGPETDLQVPGGSGKPPKEPQFELEDENFDWDKWNKKSLKDKIVNVLGSSRSVQSVDFTSALLRQGVGLIHKKSFWTSIKPAFEAMGSESNYQEIAQGILDHPQFKDAMSNGVSFTGFKNIASREEQFQSPLAEAVIPKVLGDKVPNPIRAAARGYTTFMNKLRMDAYSSLVNNTAQAGLEVNKPAIAKFINTATGRGHFDSKVLEGAMPLVNQVIYSPRLMKAHLDMLNPYTYVRQSNKGVRLEYLKSAASVAGVAGTTNLLLNLMGGKSNADMSSADFGKIKFGDTRLDPMAGNQQYLVLLHRLATNHTTNGLGKSEKLDSRFGGPTKLGTLANFVRNKLAPVPAAIVNTIAGKDGGGNSTNTSLTNNEIVKLYTPMIVQDFADLVKSDPKLIPLLIPANFGMSLQTYDTPKPKAKGFNMPKVKF